MNTETVEKEQFSALIDTYQNLVFSICYKMTSDYFASEDLTQETFISVYQHLKTFDGENPKAWICRIATNKCLDYLRKASKGNISAGDEDLEKNFLASTNNIWEVNSPESKVIEDEVKEILLKRCNSLKPPYNEIAKLFYYDEIDPVEIARQKNIKLKTVQTRLYRAREMLRKVYRKEMIRQND